MVRSVVGDQGQIRCLHAGRGDAADRDDTDSGGEPPPAEGTDGESGGEDAFRAERAGEHEQEWWFPASDWLSVDGLEADDHDPQQ